MTTLAFLLAAVLDPIQAALALAILLVYRGPQPIVVTGVTGAVLSETVMALAAADFIWGESITPRLVASLVQAAVLCWIVRLIRSAVAGIADPAAVASDTGSDSTATLRGGAGAHGQHLAAWHIRGYVRRRIVRLRHR